jgi:hypothetical protein
MGMDHGLHIWPLLVDGQVHADFAGYVPAFADPAPFHIDQDHIRGLD